MPDFPRWQPLFFVVEFMHGKSDTRRRPPSARGTAMGERLNIVDDSGLTDADWAAVNRVNRACELGGAIAFWEELEKLDDVPLQLRVLGAFFPELLRAVIEEEMTEHGLTVDDWREAERKAESPLAINRWSKLSGLFLFGCWPISGEWSCVALAAAGL